MLAALGSKLVAYGLGALAILAVIGGLWMVHLHDKAQIANLSAANAQLEAVNRVNVAELEKVKQDAAADLTAVKAAAANSQKLATQQSKIHQEISNAPAKDDGPIAPVLAHTLDELFPAAPAAGADQGSKAAGR